MPELSCAVTEADVLDAGPRKATPGSERYCAATGTVRPVDEMIRFVVGPHGRPVADLKRRLPGRGLWITGTRAALRAAIARKAFTRGFKRDVTPTPDFLEATERLLEQGTLEALAIAYKAGKVAVGFANVQAALERERVAALLHAAEAAADGVRKLDAVRRRPGNGAADVAVVAAFTSTQLDLALGRSNVIHAALRPGRESDTFLARAARLERFRGDGTGNNRADRNNVDRAGKPEEQDRNG